MRTAVAHCHTQQSQLLNHLRTKITDRQHQEVMHLRESSSVLVQLRDQEAHALAEQQEQLVRYDS